MTKRGQRSTACTYKGKNCIPSASDDGGHAIIFCSSGHFADIAVGKEAEGVWEHDAKENIWTQEGRGNGGMEETA